MKPIPTVETDEAAECFVESADLTEYNFSGFRKVRFEFQPKAAQLNMRLPQALLDAVKDQATARGIPYTRYIRDVLERAVGR